MRLGDVASDDDHCGIEEVDGSRQDLAKRASGVSHHPDRPRVAGLDEADDVAAVGGVLTSV